MFRPISLGFNIMVCSFCGSWIDVRETETANHELHYRTHGDLEKLVFTYRSIPGQDCLPTVRFGEAGAGRTFGVTMGRWVVIRNDGCQNARRSQSGAVRTIYFRWFSNWLRPIYWYRVHNDILTILVCNACSVRNRHAINGYTTLDDDIGWDF